jgi:hypothetical protein
MKLHIEKLYEVKDFIGFPGVVYSLSHYFTMNGDMVPDPDMTFLRINKDTVYPLEYQDQYSYQRGLWFEEDRWVINRKVQTDLVSFSSMWLKNIKEQQGL